MRLAVAGGTGVVGRHVVRLARGAGHEPVVLSRATGVDLVTGAGLDAALAGCEVVIDVASVTTLREKEAVRFFTAATERLLAAGRGAGVRHHIALSIVGAAQAASGYYAGKAAQERLVMSSGAAWSLLRATQFHEFAVQTAQRGAMLGMQLVPRMLSQPIAAQEVAAVLVEIAGGAPRGLDRELAGPRQERMAELVRAYLQAEGIRRPVLEVRMPGRMGAALAEGGVLPGPEARQGVQSFAEWLDSRAR